MEQENRRILLVEDDIEMHHVFDGIIHDIDTKIQVDWVSSAEAALKRLEEAGHMSGATPYELIVSDIFLDGKTTGIDLWNLCQRVYPTMPMVVMSGLPLHKFVDFVGSRAGCPPYIQKPLRVPHCRALLQEMLAER